MRGAGELLGTRQHGYIATVGFHLYTRLLAQAVRALRRVSGFPAPQGVQFSTQDVRMPVNVDLPLAVGIPIDYVPEQNMRLKLYRRIADLQSDDEIQAISDEFIDRFGPLPDPVNNLFYQFRVKVQAEAAGLTSVTIEGEQIVLRYPPLVEGVNSRNLPNIGTQVRSGKNAFWMPLGSDEQEWKTRLLETLTVVIKECPLS